MDFVCAGRAFLLSWYPADKLHLWFVLTDPYGSPPRITAVMVRSSRQFTDGTVVLDAGDHPFIKHPSSVHFGTADIFSVERILEAARKNHCHLQPDMGTKLLQRVREGLLSSAHTGKGVREYCEERFKEGKE